MNEQRALDKLTMNCVVQAIDMNFISTQQATLKCNSAFEAELNIKNIFEAVSVLPHLKGSKTRGNEKSANFGG